MKRLILPLLLCLVLFVSAQTVTIYDPYSATKQASVVNGPEVRNNLQWNFSLLTRGAFALQYERKINDYIGVEGGLGITYMDLMTELYSFDDYSETKEYNGGLFLSGALKIYPKQMDDFEGVYASPIFRYRTYSTTTSLYESYYDGFSYVDAGEDFTQNYRATDMALLIGYQYEGDSGILWNTYLGAGWTKKRYEQYEFNTTTHDWEVNVYDRGIPNIFYGVSLGFAF